MNNLGRYFFLFYEFKEWLRILKNMSFFKVYMVMEVDECILIKGNGNCRICGNYE